MKSSIINKLVSSKLFLKNSDVFIQNEETISMFDINKQEKEAMDKTVHAKKEHFNSLQTFYNDYSAKKIVEKNISIIEAMPLGQIAIDCGCGQGEYLKELSLKFEVVIAIDLSLEAILYAKNNHKEFNNIIYINGSMLDFYKVFNEPIADFCLSAEVIEHVPSPDEYLNNIYSLLKKDGTLLISTPCQNLYFYPVQFFSMLFTKPKVLYKLLNPLKYWYFALNWHPAMSKNDFLSLLRNHNFKVEYYKNFVPYYFDKFPIMFYIAKLLPDKHSLNFYKIFLISYNRIIEKIGFGIRQHSLLIK